MGHVRQHSILVALAVLVAAGAVTAAVTLTGAGTTPAIAAGCGNSASGPGFRVFACMSGGAAAGHPHPKELLVIRSDGSSRAYPAFRVGRFAERDGEVVAPYDLELVRVTSTRLVPLLTSRRLARALHVRTTAIMDVYEPHLDTRGNVYFNASILRGRRDGCRNLVLERTPRAIRQIRSSRSRTCR